MVSSSVALASVMFSVVLLACTVIPGSGIKLSQQLADESWLVYPQYTVNLDLPPRQRWKHIMEAEREPLLKVFEHLNHSWTCPDPVTCSSPEIQMMWDEITNYHGLTDDQLEELRGIEEVAQSPHVNLTHLIVAQIDYDFTDGEGACTGILARTPTGEVIQGRALDLAPVDGSKWAFGVIHVTYERGGVPLFTSINKLGSIGVHTGMHMGGYGFQEDTHFGTSKHPARSVWEAARDGAVAVLPFTRRLLEEVSDFEGAVARLSAQRFRKPHYFVLSGSGKNQGAIVRKERNATGVVTRLGETGDWAHAVGNGWRLVQGNEDTYRMAAGDSMMGMLGQERVTPDSMLYVMQQPPVLNGQTNFIYVMSPARNDWLLWDTSNKKDANVIRSRQP